MKGKINAGVDAPSRERIKEVLQKHRIQRKQMVADRRTLRELFGAMCNRKLRTEERYRALRKIEEMAERKPHLASDKRWNHILNHQEHYHVLELHKSKVERERRKPATSGKAVPKRGTVVIHTRKKAP